MLISRKMPVENKVQRGDEFKNLDERGSHKHSSNTASYNTSIPSSQCHAQTTGPATSVTILGKQI
jgi:hypothetical protein